MSNDYIIKDDVYLILIKYFKGDIINIDKKVLSKLKKGTFKKLEVTPVDKKIIKTLNKIHKLEKENPLEYANINWIYPEWSKSEKEIKLKEYFPEDYEEEPPPPPEEKVDKSIDIKTSTSQSIIIPQRKAFIDWINNNFYNELIKYHKERPEELKKIKIYQYFIKKYLSTEYPFRGLLVYHGLGTGKTATSVITAEGLSNKMPIYTLLPASLETEYIKEVKSWGDNIFKIDKNNWVFFPIDEIKGNLTLRKNLKNEYGIEESQIIQIFNKTKSILKSDLNINSQKYNQEVSDINHKLSKIKGIYLPSSSLKDEYREIYTITGKLLHQEELPIDKKLSINKLERHHLVYIEEQIYTLIRNKYNFIHYNGFPNVDKFDFKNKKGAVLDKEKLTNNDKLILNFADNFKINYDEHHIESPFRNNVIVIDEVHNFVRRIINGRAQALVFYNWIINSEDVKIIFLSGTPIINKPAEIAILFNMLRGSILVFNFTLKSSEDELLIQEKLRNHFYKEKSSIEQIHTSKEKGKVIISFTKTKTNFASIMEDDIIKTVQYNNHNLESFFNEIYDGLYRLYNPKDILPTKDDINTLLSKGLTINKEDKKRKVTLKDLKLGHPIVFDKEVGLVFNRKQTLFEVMDNNKLIDLSDNNNFIEYFLDDKFNISPKKQVFLRRLLLGLTSYSPIDRKSIKDMPQIVKPYNELSIYSDYTIVKDINIISCDMTPIQWTNYENEFTKEKIKKLNQIRRGDLYNDDDNSSYSIRTRQNCNVVYDDDTFRNNEDEEAKNKTYERMRSNGNFSYDKNLLMYSPKFYNIITNINRFIKNGIPTGKILYYSDFRKDAGSEVFEKILIENGYEKYDSNDKDIQQLISEDSKKKRFTFITGEESQEEIKKNKESFNHMDNYKGEYIQIILISSSGAEGISLKCVIQVHIMEPYWNFIRIDQVFGRAIRMESHSHPGIPENERNVEQYLYLSTLPKGDTIETLFRELKNNKWPELYDIDDGDDIKIRLFEKHKAVYKNLTKIISMKKETKDRTIDQIIFDIMEKKNIISSNIIDIIKESSVDCIQNTRDDIQLNNKCLRFFNELKKEDSHFPGIKSSELNKIDIKQFKSNFLYYIKPDTYVISAKQTDNELNKYIYYRLNDSSDEIDVRYIRENGLQICDFIPSKELFLYYELKEHELNEELGDLFSVFQSIYKANDKTLSKIKESKFPTIKDIKNNNHLIGYIIKYNISERLFFSPLNISKIIKLYDINHYIYNDYSTEGIAYIILRKGKLFKTID